MPDVTHKSRELTKSLLMVCCVKYVSDISRSKQENVGVDALWDVLRERHSRRAAHPEERLDNTKDRRCQHLQEQVNLTNGSIGSDSLVFRLVYNHPTL